VERAPQPGLAQLRVLVDEAQASAGAPIHLAVSGAPVPLEPGIELTAYRVVQEALTNARRHAPAAAVDVELEYGADTVRVRVRDGGPGPSPDAREGHGLLGMRERVMMAGGSLFAGPAPGGGYLVSAILPSTRDRP
jgi:signal transduction histidine kinase